LGEGGKKKTLSGKLLFVLEFYHRILTPLASELMMQPINKIWSAGFSFPFGASIFFDQLPLL
jgi:hypothetical protein